MDRPLAAVLESQTDWLPCSSRWLTDALQDVSRRSGISEAFIGLIILPIAGNAVEHITAVYVALRNKMDLAIAVALGSSIQISLFVIPIVVSPLFPDPPGVPACALA